MLLARRHDLLSVPQRTVCRDQLRVLLAAAVGQGRPAVRSRESLARLTIQISNAGHPALNHEKDQEHTTRDAPALRCIDGFGGISAYGGRLDRGP